MVERLRESTNTNNSSVRDEILNYAKSKYGLDSNKYNRINRVLNYIYEHKPSVSRHDMSVEECLNRVWNVADRDNILLELSECVENNFVVCSTGIFTRIINSMNDGREENALKNTSMIRDEMMNKIAVLRNKYYESLSDEDKKVFDSVDESNRQAELVDELKKRIDREFDKDYVESKLCMKEIKDEIQKELFQAI